MAKREWKLSVGIDTVLEKDSLKKAEKKLEELEKPIEVKVDTKSAEKKMDRLLSQRQEFEKEAKRLEKELSKNVERGDTNAIKATVKAQEEVEAQLKRVRKEQQGLNSDLRAYKEQMKAARGESRKLSEEEKKVDKLIDRSKTPRPKKQKASDSGDVAAAKEEVKANEKLVESIDEVGKAKRRNKSSKPKTTDSDAVKEEAKANEGLVDAIENVDKVKRKSREAKPKTSEVETVKEEAQANEQLADAIGEVVKTKRQSKSVKPKINEADAAKQQAKANEELAKSYEKVGKARKTTQDAYLASKKVYQVVGGELPNEGRGSILYPNRELADKHASNTNGLLGAGSVRVVERAYSELGEEAREAFENAFYSAPGRKKIINRNIPLSQNDLETYVAMIEENEDFEGQYKRLRKGTGPGNIRLTDNMFSNLEAILDNDLMLTDTEIELLERILQKRSENEKLWQQVVDTPSPVGVKKPQQDAKDNYFEKYQYTLENAKKQQSSILENAKEQIQENKELAESYEQVGEEAAIVQEVTNSISKNSSIKGIKNLAQEAVEVTKALAGMYDEGITDTEKYITLQYKLSKIFDHFIQSYGGIKGSGAKDLTELRGWVFDSIQQQTGTNILDISGVMENLLGDSKFSLFNQSLSGLRMKDIADLLVSTGKHGDWKIADTEKQTAANQELAESYEQVGEAAKAAVEAEQKRAKTLNMESAIKRYNKLMNDIAREHLTIGTRFSEDTDGWNIRDMVSEAQSQLNNYYDPEHSNGMLKEDGPDGYKAWVSETGKLKRFIAAFEPFIDGLYTTFNHLSKYDNTLRPSGAALQSLSALDEKAKSADDAVELFKILQARKEILGIAESESLLDEQELNNQSAINNELKKKIDLLRIATNIVYHAGDLSNPSGTMKSLPLGNVSPSRGGNNVFNGFTGLYTTEEIDGFIGNEWDGAPLSSLDLSYYKLFDAKNDELAKKAQIFFDDLNSTIYGYYRFFDHGFDELQVSTDVKTVEALYDDFKSVFKGVDLDFDAFNDFVTKSRAIVEGHKFEDIEVPAISDGIAKSHSGTVLQGVPKEVFNSDSFKTQLLKILGFDGIDLRGTKFNGTYTGGTVIFDVKPESVKTVNEKWSDVMAKHGYKIDEDALQLEEKRRQLAFETAEAYSKQAESQKEISAEMRESSNLGYHAGDLGKAETYGNFAYGARGTGHFGTGTYFVGNEKAIEGYNSRNGVPAPVERVDFSKYNLFKPSDTEEAYDLHRALKMINDDLIDLHRFDDLDLDFLVQSYENGDTSPVLNFLNNYLNDSARSHYEDEALGHKSYLESLDESQIREEAHRSYTSMMSDLLDADELSDELLIIDELIESSVQERLQEVKQSLENFDLDKEIAKRVVYDIEHGNFESISDMQTFKDTVVDRLSKFFVGKTKEELSNALEETFKTISQYSESEYYKVDNASTVFMKQLGYEGIDVRHTELDNTAFGSVIYDLKGEDLARRQEILGVEKQITAEQQEQVQATKDINSQKESTQWIDELRAKADTLDEEFKNSQQYQNFFAAIEDGSITAADGMSKLEEAFHAFNAASVGSKAASPIEEIPQLLSASQLTKAFDAVDLGTYFKSLNITDEGAIQTLKELYLQLLQLIRAEDSSIDVGDRVNNTWNEIINTIMRFGSVTYDAATEYKEFWKAMQNSKGEPIKLTFNSGQVAEFGDDWKATKKRFGRYLTPLSSGRGIGVDQIWDELSKFGLFKPEDANNEQSQLKAVLRELGKAMDLKNNGWKISSAISDDYGINTDLGNHVTEMMAAALRTEEAVEKEETALKGLEGQAEKTANAKKKVTKANKELGDAAVDSKGKLEGETEAAEELEEKVKNVWSTPRQGGSIEGLNLPAEFIGENGQDVVQMFAKIKGEIEELTGNPVKIDFVSKPNKDGELEAVGATLEYINKESGVTVKQFYDIARGEDDVIIATQTAEKATLKATKAQKAFNAELKKRLALEQIETLKKQMGEFPVDLTAVYKAANAITDKASFDEFNLQLKIAQESLRGMKAEMKGQNTLDPIVAAEKRLKSLGSELDSLKNKFVLVTGADTDTKWIDDQIASIKRLYELFNAETDPNKKTGYYKQIITEISAAENGMTNLNELIRIQNKLFKDRKTLSKMDSSTESYKILEQSVVLQGQELSNLIRNSQHKETIMQRAIKFENELAAAVQDRITKQEQAFNKRYAGVDVIQNGSWDKNVFADYQDAMKAFANDVLDGNVQVNGFNKSGTEMYVVLSDAEGALHKITVALEKSSGKMIAFKTGTNGITDALKELGKSGLQQVTRVAGMYIGVNDFIRYFSQGVQHVRDIDASMTELRKVTDETEASYAKFLETASDAAGKIGSTVKDFTTVTSDFARLGYSIEEASEMARTALIYENVGDGFASVEEASESIISTMKAFGIEAEDTMGIVDRFNEVGI